MSLYAESWAAFFVTFFMIIGAWTFSGWVLKGGVYLFKKWRDKV